MRFIKGFASAIETYTPDIVQVNDAGGRHYVIEDSGVRFEYISCTEFLSQLESDPGWKDRWQSRVGLEKAEAVQNYSLSFGTAMHNIIEHCLRYEISPVDLTKMTNRSVVTGYLDEALDDNSFTLPEEKLDDTETHLRYACKSILEYLAKTHKTIIGCEEKVFSDTLKIAGTLDLLSAGSKVYQRGATVIDLKQSRAPKNEKWIKTYLFQVFIYGMALREMITKYVQPNVHSEDLYQTIYESYYPDNFEILIWCRCATSKYLLPHLQVYSGKLDDLRDEFSRAYAEWKMRNSQSPPFPRKS